VELAHPEIHREGQIQQLTRYKNKMSSQGMNASSTGYPAGAQVVSPYYFPPRDASDITRITRERLIRVTNGSTTPATYSTLPAPKPFWIRGGNQYRLSYLFGKVECGFCNSGNGGNPWTVPTLGS